jgi:hypothetical protein
VKEPKKSGKKPRFERSVSEAGGGVKPQSGRYEGGGKHGGGVVLLEFPQGQSPRGHRDYDFAGIGIYGRKGQARERVAVLRCGLCFLHENCAVACADSAAERNGNSAVTGSASRGAVGITARGVAARDAVCFRRWPAVWRRGRGGGIGARNLVGATVGMDGEGSRNDEDIAKRLPVCGGAAKLRGGFLQAGGTVTGVVAVKDTGAG